MDPVRAAGWEATAPTTVMTSMIGIAATAMIAVNPVEVRKTITASVVMVIHGTTISAEVMKDMDKADLAMAEDKAMVFTAAMVTSVAVPITTGMRDTGKAMVHKGTM